MKTIFYFVGVEVSTRESYMEESYLFVEEFLPPRHFLSIGNFHHRTPYTCIENLKSLLTFT